MRRSNLEDRNHGLLALNHRSSLGGLVVVADLGVAGRKSVVSAKRCVFSAVPRWQSVKQLYGVEICLQPQSFSLLLSLPFRSLSFSLSLCHFRSLLLSLSFLIPSLSLSLCAHETSARTCTQPGRRFSLIHGSVPLAALLPDGSITDNNRVEALPCKTAR